MKYIRVDWLHTNLDDPIVLYSELDERLWEVRKVEVFRDGHCGHASQNESCGGTEIGTMPLPPLTEIAGDPQFRLAEITKDEFESVWSERDPN